MADSVELWLLLLPGKVVADPRLWRCHVWRGSMVLEYQHEELWGDGLCHQFLYIFGSP